MRKMQCLSKIHRWCSVSHVYNIRFLKNFRNLSLFRSWKIFLKFFHNTHFKSVHYSYWKATVNKNVTIGHAIYLLSRCSWSFAQCVLETNITIVSVTVNKWLLTNYILNIEKAKQRNVKWKLGFISKTILEFIFLQI